jgi:hypothetical protein
MKETEIAARHDESEELVAEIGPILHGHSPDSVGAALGELLAIVIAGHHPDLRESVLEALVKLVKDLTAITVEEMIENGKAPPDWRGATKQ